MILASFLNALGVVWLVICGEDFATDKYESFELSCFVSSKLCRSSQAVDPTALRGARRIRRWLLCALVGTERLLNGHYFSDGTL